jgi:tetratricopeptide (TPR) repeat protein
VFLATLSVASLILAIQSLEAQDTPKDSSLPGWLETTLGKESPYIQDIKEINEEKLILIANTLCERKEYQQAVEIYRKVLEEYNSADAAYNLGLTYEINLKNSSLALLYYSKFLSLEPRSPDAEAVRSWIEHIKKKKRTISESSEHEKDKMVSETSAVITQPAEKKSSSKWTLRTGVPIFEDDIPSFQMDTAKEFLRTGNEHYLQGHYEQAIENFKQALNFYDSTDAYYNIGVTYHMKLKKPGEAIRFYRRYLDVDTYSDTAKEIRKLLEQAETELLMQRLKKEKSLNKSTE